MNTPIINGKQYPLWSGLVESKASFIGKILEDFGDSRDRAFGCKSAKTIIIEVQLLPNGTDSASFHIIGENFQCGCDVQYLGIREGEPGWINFDSYGGHKFRIENNSGIAAI